MCARIAHHRKCFRLTTSLCSLSIGIRLIGIGSRLALGTKLSKYALSRAKRVHQRPLTPTASGVELERCVAPAAFRADDRRSASATVASRV
jgi:hypothetical protein